MKKWKTITLPIIFFCLLASAILHAETVERPPQYVLLAFDGSLNIDMWEETLAFAKKNNIKFSYFLSGVYFLLDENKSDYIEPTKGIGKSDIGFAGDSKSNLINRVGFLNKAYDEGHTIGSHANGHFDASNWSVLNWELEFSEFNNLIFNVFNQNGLEIQYYTNPLHFKQEQITGFRSPLLATNSNLYTVLKNNKFEYDTSQTDSMDYWPRINDGIWNFPLAELRIFGTGIETLSMDYNFYYTDSAGKPDLVNAEKYRQQMYKTYMAYFYSNYYGNRAPINIGHHFSKWNGGAYWLALGDFVNSVCNQVEVKCVGYQSLVKFMNSLNLATRHEYQVGNFPKLPIPPKVRPYISAVSPIDVKFIMKKNNQDEISLSVTGKHAPLFLKMPGYKWIVNDKYILKNKLQTLKINSLKNRFGSSFKLSALLESKNTKLLKTSHLINIKSLNSFNLSDEDLENRAIKGDLPEAHKD